MNKQELIEKVEALPDNIGLIRPHIDKKIVLGLVRQLDEPQKVKVPQFVAEWYEENKTNLEYNIWEYIHNWDKQNVSQIKTWFDYSSNKPLQTLINMHQFGYEVEKEKRYIVSLKNGQPLVKAPLGGNFYFNQNITAGNYKATRKELEEAGFGWIFSCEGIEIEEVE